MFFKILCTSLLLVIVGCGNAVNQPGTSEAYEGSTDRCSTTFLNEYYSLGDFINSSAKSLNYQLYMLLVTSDTLNQMYLMKYEVDQIRSKINIFEAKYRHVHCTIEDSTDGQTKFIDIDSEMRKANTDLDRVEREIHNLIYNLEK